MRNRFSNIIAGFMEVMKDENGFLDLCKAVAEVVFMKSLNIPQVSEEATVSPDNCEKFSSIK
jgi:hypothetical protein